MTHQCEYRNLRGMTFPVTGIAEALWLKAKMRALKDGMSMQAVLHRLIAEYVNYGLRKD